MLFEKFINFIDINYHHKRIIKFLQNYDIDILIDVGSHKGEFVSNIIKYRNLHQIYTFEPQKKIFEDLKGKLENNKIFIHNNLAISKFEGYEEIKISKLSSTSTMSKENKNSFYLKFKKFLLRDMRNNIEKYKIKTTTLDIYFKNIKLTNCLLKIDVEGYEHNVLLGSKGIIKNIKFLIIEKQYFNMYENSFSKDCEEFLFKNSFKLLKKFRFPLLHFEDRIYINTTLEN